MVNRLDDIKSRSVSNGGGPAHYGLSPSGAKRWMQCPASIALSKGIEDKSSKYADEGTAAHYMAERAVEYGMDPSDPDSYDILVDAVPEAYKKYVSKTMADNLQCYYDYISAESGSLGNVLTEVKLRHWEIADLGGTVDAAHINSGDNVLRITDLKYGKGEMVEVEGNHQLMIYAALALGPYNAGRYDAVKLAIVQPRNYDDRGPVRTAEYSVESISDWYSHVLLPAVKAATSGDTSTFGPSADACKWCKAKALCPALYNKMYEAAKEDFKAVADKAVPSLSPEQIADRLSIADLASSWAEEVKSYAKEQIRRGVEVPGWTVSEAKGAASYTDEESAMAELSIMYGDKDICRLKTITQVAKIIGRDNLAPYITDGATQYRLKRGKSTGCAASTASEDFAEIPVDNTAHGMVQEDSSNAYIYCEYKGQRTAKAVCKKCKRIKKCDDAKNAGLTA